MTDNFVEGVLFAFIVGLMVFALTGTPRTGDTCYRVGNPGSYVCE